MLLPLLGDRLDPNPGQTDLPAVVGDPEAHRVAHLGVVRPVSEDELPLAVDPACQVNGHGRSSGLWAVHCTDRLTYSANSGRT